MIFLSFNLASAGGGLTEELVFFSITCSVFVTALYFLDFVLCFLRKRFLVVSL